MSYLPSNWKIFPLGELCRIEIGKTPARKNPKYWDIKKINNNVWLSIADLKQLRYFQEMVSKDLRPTQVTMNAMMNACSKAEKPDEAEALFERMKKNDIPRSRMSYHTLMDAHARAKNKDRVFELLFVGTKTCCVIFL